MTEPAIDWGAFSPTNPFSGYQPLSQGFGIWGQGMLPGGGGLDINAQMARNLDAQYNQSLAETELAKRSGQPLTGFAKGAQTFGSIAQGLQGLGSIYLGLQSMKQQKKAFEFNKGVTNTNLNNSIMDYNRRLSDTLTNRSLNNGQGQGWVSDQLAKYSAKRSG